MVCADDCDDVEGASDDGVAGVRGAVRYEAAAEETTDWDVERTLSLSLRAAVEGDGGR